MIEFDKVIDISLTLGPDCPPFPGDPPIGLRSLMSLAEGDPAEVSQIEMSVHGGTHIDLPAHFCLGRPTLEDIPASRFILPAVVADCTGERVVSPATVRRSGAGRGDALLLRTSNSTSGLVREPVYRENYAHLSVETAAACVELGLALVGIDYFSVDGHDDQDYPVHKILLDAGLFVLERIDLAGAPPGRYTLLTLPLKISGAEASPVRALLLC